MTDIKPFSKPFMCRYVDDDLAKLREHGNRGWGSAKVLPELTGVPYGDLVLAHVHGLSPRNVRLCRHGQNDDSRTGRINIYIDDDDRVVEIVMETEVALPVGVKHAADLDGRVRAAKVKA